MATFRHEAELIGIGSAPLFGIGQRALLVRTPHGNVLWDCIGLIDDAMVEIINGLGGLKAIAISHPHYYTTMTEWSAAFGDIPVYLHAADKPWIMRSAPCLELWRGETKEISPGLTLIRAGGHFEGGTVMHWAEGAGKKGALLSGDLLQVTADRKFVSFMWSYPNFIPLGGNAVQSIGARLEPWSYDVIYGAFWDRVIAEDGSASPQGRSRVMLKYCSATHLEVCPFSRSGAFGCSRGCRRRSAPERSDRSVLTGCCSPERHYRSPVDGGGQRDVWSPPTPKRPR